MIHPLVIEIAVVAIIGILIWKFVLKGKGPWEK
jgi:hypothetical protein